MSRYIFFRIIFSFLVSVAFCLLVFTCFFFFVVVVVFCLSLKLKIYILIHIQLCGRLSDQKKFIRPISGNKTNFFRLNQNQPLKCVRQNSYLDLWSYTLHIIWKGVHLLVKLQGRETSKWTTKMKSPTGISQGFDKSTKATSQNSYFWGTPPDDYFCLEIWSQYHNKKRQKFKTILILRSSRKMNRNKKLSKFSNAQKTVVHTFSLQLCSTANSKFSFNVSRCEIA